MRIQSEYMSFNNRWTISSSYDFQAHLQYSRRTCSIPGAPAAFQAHLQHFQGRCFSPTAQRWFEVLPDLSAALPGAPNVLSSALRCSQTYHNHSHGTPVPVIRYLSYSEGRPQCPPIVWYSPEIDVSKFTLHILSDTSGGFQRLKYILLMLHFWYTSPDCVVSVRLLSSGTYISLYYSIAGLRIVLKYLYPTGNSWYQSRVTSYRGGKSLASLFIFIHREYSNVALHCINIPLQLWQCSRMGGDDVVEGFVPGSHWYGNCAGL